VLDQLLDSHGDNWRKTHATQYRNSMATYCKPLFDLSVNDVDTAMLLRCIEGEWRRAPETLDRVRRRIGEVLAFAEVRGLRKPGPNPTRWKGHLDQLLPHPKKLKPVVHHPAMKYDDVPNLFKKLVASDSIPELALAFAILTAARSQEAGGARWDEIDFATGVWTIPPSRMKRAREHRVPLSAEAMKLIERLPRTGELMFSTGTVPIASLALRRALKRHGCGDFTVHGFRSSFRDWGSERTGAPREILEVALAHAIGSRTEVAYARGDLLERRRRIMESWALHCTSPTQPANHNSKIVSLR
jgi:integrase